MTSTERPAGIYWCSSSLLLLLHLSSNSATHNRTSLDNHYLNILYWSICSQCISSRFIPSFTMTKAAHCDLNMPLPGPQETSHWPLSVLLLHRHGQPAAELEKQPGSPSPKTPSNPLLYEIPGSGTMNHFIEVTGLLHEWVSLYPPQSFLWSPLCFFKFCFLGCCDLQLKNSAELTAAFSQQGMCKAMLSSPDGSSLVLQDTEIFSKASFSLVI